MSGERAERLPESEPFLLSSLRRNPTGDIRHNPEVGGGLGTSARGFLAEYDEYVRERMAQAWDEALAHVWELNDPAYTILTDTESIHPLLTRNDVDQARRENPYSLGRDAS